jgi:hypothetical protein
VTDDGADITPLQKHQSGLCACRVAADGGVGKQRPLFYQKISIQFGNGRIQLQIEKNFW